MSKFRQEMLRGQLDKGSGAQSKYLEYLQIYENPVKSETEQNKSLSSAANGYKYNSDYRILLRREL